MPHERRLVQKKKKVVQVVCSDQTPGVDVCVRCVRRWAQLRGSAGGDSRPDADFATQPMVMNVGMRPTMGDAGGLTVEVGLGF